jgi:hypothetical protein
MKPRSKALLVGLGIVALLLVVVVGPRLSPLGSGSGWEFDYEIQQVTVNGEGFGSGTQDTGASDPPTINTARDYTHLDRRTYRDPVVHFLSILSQDAYQITLDPDGAPASNWQTGVHDGLSPNVYFQMSQAWRVNEFGERIAMSAPTDYEVEVSGEMWYYYYYAFSIYAETQSRPFNAYNQYGAIYLTAEAGTLDCELVIEARLQETVFGDVTGEFMDATIDHTETNLEELFEAGVTFALYPDVSPSPAGSAVEIQDRTQTEDAYACTMHFPFTLQCGLTRIDAGQNYVPADVWVSYRVITTLLLREPLQIGTQGQDLEGGLPPDYAPPFDWRLVLIIIGIAVFALIAFFIYVRFRQK